jgi:cytochrome b561
MSEAAAWPLPLRLIHWLSAALILGTLVLGFCMVQLVANPARRFDLTQIHKSIGVTILALSVLRLCVRIVMAASKPDRSTPRLAAAAEAAHIGLYALIVIVPLSGWLMVSTTPVRVPTSVFSLFDLPYPLLPDMALYRLAHIAHVAVASALAALVALHIAAAAMHALWWRDSVFGRIWRAPRPA